MKFTVSFKTPDAFFYLKQDLKKQVKNQELTDDEYYAVEDIEEKFVQYGEYVNIEFDTETMSAKVLKVK